MKKGNGLSEHEKRQLKNNKYRQNMIKFYGDHTHKDGGEFYTISSINNETLVVVITCKQCRKSITFYYHQ